MPSLPHWRLSAWYFFYFAFIGAFSPYFTLYLQSAGQSALAIGTLMSLMQVMRLLAPNLWGWLAERRGGKTDVVRASALLSAAGFLPFFLTQDFWGLFLAMGALTFFWSASLPLVEALTLDHLHDRPERYGSIRLWGSVGFVVAVLGTGAWLDLVAIESLLLICLALLLGIAACTWGLRDAAPRPASTSPSLQVLLRRREIIAFLLASFFMSAAHGPLYVFYSIHLVEHGYGKTAVGALWSLGVLAEILVFMYWPRLLRHVGLRTILLTSFGLAVIRFLLIGWAADSAAALFVAQLMHGATFGAYHAAAVAAFNHWFPGQHQARAQAIYGSISFGAGGMVGGLASGQAWESLGPAATYSLGSCFAVIGLILIWRGVLLVVPSVR